MTKCEGHGVHNGSILVGLPFTINSHSLCLRMCKWNYLFAFAKEEIRNLIILNLSCNLEWSMHWPGGTSILHFWWLEMADVCVFFLFRWLELVLFMTVIQLLLVKFAVSLSGALVTAGVLTAGLISFRQGNSQLGQKLMRARVVVQGATVALMVGTAFYYGENPWRSS